MKNDEAPSRRVDRILRGLFANPWLLGLMLTILGIISVYLGTHSPSIEKLGAGGVFGAAIGAAYLVEVRFSLSETRNRITCAIIGAVAGGVICFLSETSTNGVLIGIMVGLILGATSKKWISQVNLP